MDSGRNPNSPTLHNATIPPSACPPVNTGGTLTCITPSYNCRLAYPVKQCPDHTLALYKTATAVDSGLAPFIKPENGLNQHRAPAIGI